MTELGVDGNDVIDNVGVGHRSSHLLKYTGVIHQHWHLYDDIIMILPTSDNKWTYHIWIIRVQAKLSEWIDASHSSESQMAVELCKGIMYVLPSLHRGYLLRWQCWWRRHLLADLSFDHMNGMTWLYPVCRELVIVLNHRVSNKVIELWEVTSLEDTTYDTEWKAKFIKDYEGYVPE